MTAISNRNLSVVMKKLNKSNKPIKSPTIGLTFPHIPTKNYQVIATFRDIRPVIMSVLSHNHRKSIVAKNPFWKKYYNGKQKLTEVGRIIACWGLIYESILSATNLKVLNYGYWDEWKQNCDVDAFRAGMSPHLVSENDGKIVTEYKSIDFDYRQFALSVTSYEYSTALTMQNHIIALYKTKGYELKGLKQ